MAASTVLSFLDLWFSDARHDNDARTPGVYHKKGSTDTNSTALLASPTLEAFEQLYRERFEALCDYAFRFLHSRDEARDIVQDVFVRVWHRREDVWSRGDPVAYLVASTRHAALNALRHHNIETRYADAMTREQSVSSDTVSPVAHPLLDRVNEFIDALPERSREVLVLRWRHGLSLEQIATAMGIGIASVRVTHARAVAMLRERLGGA